MEDTWVWTMGHLARPKPPSPVTGTLSPGQGLPTIPFCNSWVLSVLAVAFQNSV